MKNLLLALPLSLLLLSTAQAQESQHSHQDFLQGMMMSMAGQLYGQPADPSSNPVLQALKAEREERQWSFESNTITRPILDHDRLNREPISRPLR